VVQVEGHGREKILLARQEVSTLTPCDGLDGFVRSDGILEAVRCK